MNAAEEAALARRDSPTNIDGDIDILGLATIRGCRVSFKDLRADEGGSQALLVPLIIGGFSILVDNKPTTEQEWERLALPEQEPLEKALVKYRVAHEIGHTLFFKPGAPPQRIVPNNRLMPNKAEETFCNEFAAALLVSPERAIEVYSQGPEKVIEATREYSINAYAWLLSANQYEPISAYAGSVQHDGQKLVAGRTFMFGMSQILGSWAFGAGLESTIGQIIREDGVDPAIPRRFLAFPDVNKKEIHVVLENLKVPAGQQ